MNGDTRPQYGRQRRVGPGRGAGRGGGRGAGDGGSLAGRTTVRALVALGTYVAQDIRDPEGMARPMLRRTALRMVASRQGVLRRIGSAYLRADPPSERQLPLGSPEPPADPENDAEVIDVTPGDVEDAV